MQFFLIFSMLSFFKGTKNANKVIVTYFTDWTTRHMNVDQLPYSKITHINYSFAVLKSNYDPYFETPWLLPKAVQKAHEHGVKILMSVGGWTGSRYFSSLVKSAEKRKTFIGKLVAMMNEYGLDGIDLDYEYPGRMGMECNEVDKKTDALGFIKLVEEMRVAFGSKLITLAVRVEPFDGPRGPMKDMTALAKVVDFINIMAYDINGSWTNTTGPNAPMDYKVGYGQAYGYKQSIDSWLNSGVPKDKIVMGLPFYGRSLKLQSGAIKEGEQNPSIYQRKEPDVPRGDENDAQWADPCPGAKWVYSGIWRWRNLRRQQVLTSPLVAGPGWKRYWDSDSQTPWLYHAQSRIHVSYDDPQSLKIKVDYLLEKGLRGAMVWSSEQDNGELMEVLQPILGNHPSPIPTSSPGPVDPPPDGNCPTDGLMQCDSKDKTTLLICNNHKWFRQSCPAGTVCKAKGGSVNCDFAL